MASNRKHKNTVAGIVNVKKNELVKIGYTDFQDWISTNKNLYIGRDMNFYVKGATASIWQNPYPVAKTDKEYKCTKPRFTLDESLNLYRQHIENNPHLLSKLRELNGKVLGCWCKPGRCHGDVLAELVEKHCN
jgi:hypothetical protein